MDQRVNPLGLDTPGVTKEQVQLSYEKCQRAVRLLQNRDFITWKADVEAGLQRMIRKLIANTDNSDRKRGMIVGIERLYSELDLQAKGLESLAGKLEEYERRDSSKHDDQRNWLR